MNDRRKTEKLRAAVYARVSTEEQAHKRMSLRMQASRGREYAKRERWKVVKTVSDAGHSGKDLRRPGMRELRDLIRRREVDVLIVYRLDRLSRNLRHMLAFVHEEIANARVDFVSTCQRFDTTTANGRLVLHLMGMLAEFERDIISERTRDTLASKRERQEFTGGRPPYGYRIASKKPLVLRQHRGEQEAIAAMLKQRADGWSFQSIADHLNAEHIRPQRARRWSANTVRKIVRREEPSLSPRPGR